MYSICPTVSICRPAILALPPDADGLVLVGQVLPIAPIVVVALDGASGLDTEEVLCTPLWGQVAVVARVLGHLVQCDEKTAC